ncbi:MAG: DUF4388 domain-containing protein [Candidatus Dormibacteria bacterium]
MPLAPTGSLTESPVRSVLERLEADKATGALRLNRDGAQLTLYFLFGKVLHAEAADATGDGAIALLDSYEAGSWEFDSRSNIPKEESVHVARVAELFDRPVVADAIPEPESEPVHMTEVTEDALAPSSPPAVESTAAPDAARGTFAGARHLDEILPIPHGEVLYDQLKSSFVDFPRLLETQLSEGHTGYIRFTGPSNQAVLLMSSGQVVGALFEGGEMVSSGLSAFRMVADSVAEGKGVLDVVRLAPEVVTSLHQLIAAETLYAELYGSFIDLGRFVEFLGTRGINGVVLVRSGDVFGVVMLQGGQVVGTYSSDRPDLQHDTARVFALAADPEARIEVRGGEVTEAEPLTLPAPRVATTAILEATPNPGPVGTNAAEPVREATAVEEFAGAPEAEVDWGRLIAQLNGLADAALSTRSKRVKDMLAATPPQRAALLDTIDRVAGLSMGMFVDKARLARLAGDMRDLVESH